MPEPLLTVDRLTISYEYPTVQEAVILDSANCLIFKNHIHFIEGPNGSGKTSFFRTLIGLQNENTKFIKMSKNEVRISGKELSRTLKIGYIPQFPHEALVPQLSILENLYLRTLIIDSRSYRHPLKWFTKASSPEHLEKFSNQLTNLKIVERILRGRLYDPFHTFSGGELQILNLASVLCFEAELLVMDEPTGKLDRNNRIDFWNTLAQVVEHNNITVLSTTHEDSYLSTSVMQKPHVRMQILDRKIITI